MQNLDCAFHDFSPLDGLNLKSDKVKNIYGKKRMLLLQLLGLLGDAIAIAFGIAVAIWVYKKMNPEKKHCPHCGESLTKAAKHGINPDRKEPTINEP
ncbi:hypothetical protein [Collimonas fungivorans]|uniref:hypothetical protein n=1 Tax=Collimonas fungivorans TaxID=158899 RepID=UPI0011D205C4|nr:hypothetical protein [Collimonas fungivorans]